MTFFDIKKSAQQIVTVIINTKLYKLIFIQVLHYRTVLYLWLNLYILSLDLNHIQNKMENNFVLLQKQTQNAKEAYSSTKFTGRRNTF